MRNPVMFVSISVLVFSTALFLEGMASQEELVLYLSFDDGPGVVKDRSPDPADVEIKGTLKWVEGKIGQAVEFDGTNKNYIEVSHAGKLEGMEALTIEAWVKPYSPDDLPRGIVSKRKGWGQPGDVYNLFSWKGKKIYGRVNAQADLQIISSTVLEDKKWYHIAYVFDGKAPKEERQKLYINGKLEAVKWHPHESVNLGEQQLWIGILNEGYAQAWKGVIDEVRIWSRALNEEEIKAAMEGRLLPVKPQGKLATAWGKVKLCR